MGSRDCPRCVPGYSLTPLISRPLASFKLLADFGGEPKIMDQRPLQLVLFLEQPEARARPPNVCFVP